MIVDVHCHLNHEDFAGDLEAVLERAEAAGVGGIINVGWDLPSSAKAVELAEKIDICWAAVGVHPHDAKDVDGGMEQELIKLAEHPKVVAMGEVGLDYHYDHSPRPVQQEVFRRQLAVARQLNMPVVIHSREADRDTMLILEEFAPPRCLLHCYGGSWETAQLGLKRGYYFSFGGPVTFKNAKRPVEVVSKLPVERLMLETDAPYLAPEPNRGKRNEPAFLVHTLGRVAQLKEIPEADLARLLKENVESFFQISLGA
ncbi:MAG TPA: TatD family hydrolase [Bacillota bacterium]|nr:TatD family hydrolase [Bacillota bacterium]